MPEQEKLHKYKIEEAVVIRQEEIAKDIYSIWVRTSIAEDAAAGQFVSVYSKNGATLLPRPISI